MDILTATLNGKRIAYTSETVFLVQVGKEKSAYRTRYAFTGNLGLAAMYYRCINIGNGYKKRLIAPSLNKALLARSFS